MKKKVLVVDDDVDLRDVMRFKLEHEGYHVFEAADGRQALEVLVGDVPDLMIVDARMPVMDGQELVALVRRDERFQKTPIFILTANIHAKDEFEVFEETYFFTKPFDSHELLMMMSVCLATKSSKQ